MAFKITNNVTNWTCGAGEPITFAYRPCDASGTPEPLANRSFVWAVYTVAAGVRREVAYLEAQVVDQAYWLLDGTYSNGWYNMANLRWDIAERRHNGRDTVASGSLAIEDSAPRIDDLPGAQIAGYIHQISRLNDPATIDAPVLQVGVVAFAQPISRGLNFSSIDNSTYLAALGF